MSAYYKDTICAIATAPGRGAVGILRVSGPKAQFISEQILRSKAAPRHAHFLGFHIEDSIVDQGIALYFPGPNSFTGEDILELQCHGGPIIVDMLMKEVVRLGARVARPGEFSERAFLNDKIDLTQAEAIADLIEASSAQAAKQAMNSLQGEFSKKVHHLVEQLIHTRMYVESAIDFPEEEIDFLSDGKIAGMVKTLLEHLEKTLEQAQQGVLLREGMNVVIAGRPNAGKSSLLNLLAENDLAIVTDIAGTTRDVLKEQIHIDGLPLHIIDTAGLRDSPDTVEKIGIERAWNEINNADRILLMIDSSDEDQLRVNNHWSVFTDNPDYLKKLTVIYNKIDVSGFQTENSAAPYTQLYLSALNGTGIDSLKAHLKQVVGYQGTSEGQFSARRRHLEALERAKADIDQGILQLETSAAGELLAEDLKSAQHHLSEITGSFTPDDLLGTIFSSFCIGK